MKKSIVKLAMVACAVIASVLLSGSLAFAQNRSISGTVVDGSGAPVIGATVMVVGNNSIGAVTNVDGAFTLNVPAGATISVSCIGYATQTVPVGNQTVFNFILEEDTEFLEETVVIGYGVQRKSDVTGSVASVRQDDLRNRSTANASAALQGKAAGVQILNLSAAPGAESQIRVRGYSSNSGNIGPLLIVDGLQVDNIQYLDPEMIESMEVLKDAASAAIYGAQAGNGVVLITTKSGNRSREGQIFINSQYTINTLSSHAQMMNAEQYIAARKAGNLITDASLDAAGYVKGTDTNWQDVVFEPSVTKRTTVGFQGRNDRGSLYIALGHYDDDGIVKGDKDTYQRLSAQINAEYRIKDWLTVGSNSSIERWSRNSVGQQTENASVLGPALINDPLTKPYLTYEELPQAMKNALADGYKLFTSPDGLYYGVSQISENDGGGNPLAQRDISEPVNRGTNIRGTLYGNLTPFKGLTITSRFGYRIGTSYSSSYSEPYFINVHHKSENYSINSSNNENMFYQWENFANYETRLGKHTVSAMAGMSYIENNSSNTSANASGPDILSGYASNFHYLNYVNNNASTSKGMGGQTNKSANLSYFGRLGWSYDNRYNLQVNFRADAFDSSKLSAKNRWGYFPSVSAGWTISNEEFMKGISRDVLSLLKVRASWGVNGNVSVLNGYPYATTISYNSNWYQFGEDPTFSYGSAPSGLPNPDLTWETSVQFDFGIDARFLSNRLTVALDYYNKQTRDLLINITPPLELGMGSTTVNAGRVLNEGVEFEASWRDNIGDFNYSLSGNLAYLKNKVTYLDPTVGRIRGAGLTSSKMQTRFEVGYPVWYIAGFEYEGIDSEGKAIIKDQTGDGLDDNDLTMIGCGIPDWTYGLTFNAEYKGFDLTVFGTGTIGNDIFACFYRTDRPMNNSLALFWEESYDKKGASAKYPAIAPTVTDNFFWSSNATLFDGSFFKIKEVQLGYTLPKALTRKVFVDNLRLFVSLDDYFTFTKYPGLDPETATAGSANSLGIDKGSFPTSKKCMFGVNITF